MRSHLVRLSLVLPCLAALACTSSATTPTVVRPELVQVLPEDFLGIQRCGQGMGLVGSYVATLFDVTPGADGMPLDFPLPSSPPTSCYFPVTFGFVIPNHSYRAEIDAYEDLFADGTPLVAGEGGQGGEGGASGGLTPDKIIKPVNSGLRLQQTEAGVLVSPRWKATCGGYASSAGAGGTGGASATGGSAGSTGGANDADQAGEPGVISYDGRTITVHSCGKGLLPVD